MWEKLDIITNNHVEFKDVTGEVQQVVTRSRLPTGMCYLYVPHTTAAVLINENADPDVMADIAAGLERAVPFAAGYRHVEGNSAAHIKSVLVGQNATLFIENSRLVLGTWQGIFFAEFDGPRRRQLYVKITGD